MESSILSDIYLSTEIATKHDLYLVNSELSNYLSANLSSNFALSTELSNYLSANLSSLFVTVDNLGELTDFVRKNTDNEISGNLGIFQKNLTLISGNFKQTATPDGVINYSSKNSFIQAEEAYSGSGESYGPAYTGTKGFCILSVDVANKAIKLSGNISTIEDLVDGIYNGPTPEKSLALRKLFTGSHLSSFNIKDVKFSFALGGQQGATNIKVLSIKDSTDKHGTIIVDNIPTELTKAAQDYSSEQDYIDAFKNDDNALYVVGFPEVGNTVIENFYAQHAEGGSTRAIGKYTHAEGRDNVADVRYSHVEGSHNIAGAMGTHVEGFYNAALGRYSHIENYNNTDNGFGFSHVEGRENMLSGDYAHAEGYQVIAGYLAHAEGTSHTVNGVKTKNIVMGTGSHVEGRGNNIINANGAHAEGTLNVISGSPDTHIEGYQNFIATNANISHVEGQANRVSSKVTHVEGYNNLVEKDNKFSHVEGEGHNLIGVGNNTGYIHAEGYKNIVSGLVVHAEGWAVSATGNGSHVEGRENKASGMYSHAEGHITEAISEGSHAEGYGTKSISEGSHAEGRRWNNLITGVNPQYVIASGVGSHAEGRGNVLSGNGSHIEGTANVLSTGADSHVEGYNNLVSGNVSVRHVEGHSNNVYLGQSFHVEGQANTISTSGSSVTASHVEGMKNILSGPASYSHVEGYLNTCGSKVSHVEGEGNIVSGNGYAHVEGYHNIAGYVAHAGGWFANAKDNYSYVWNGEQRSDSNRYVSHGNSTFNINPVGGLSGVYVGEQNLAQILSTRIPEEILGKNRIGYPLQINYYGNPEYGSLSVDGQNVLINSSVYFPNAHEVDIKYTSTHSDDCTIINSVPIDPISRHITLNSMASITVAQYMCLSPDTKILMSDRTEKLLKDIVPGDKILAVDSNGNLVEDVVTKTSTGTGKAVDTWTFEDGTTIETIGRHRFYNADLKEFMYLEAWNTNESARNINDKNVKLVKHENTAVDNAPHATLFTEKYNTYFANGLLAGNRYSIKLKI